MAGKNILIIDDDSKTVNAMVEVLESEGLAAFAASTKKSALELTQKIKPSLIYVNAILTDASGLEITRSIRSIDAVKNVPIVMLTEMEEEFSDRYQSTYGIVGFLKKPIDKKELLKKTLSCVQLDDVFPEIGHKAAPPGTAHESAPAGGVGFGEVDLAEGPEKEEHTVPPVEDMDFEQAHESTMKPEPSGEKAVDPAPAATQEPKQPDRGSPQSSPIAEKKEVKPTEQHEQLPVPRKAPIPGKPTVKKVEVDENFNPDDLFRDAKRPIAGTKKGSLGSGAARKEERGGKRNLLRNVVITGIALSSVLVIVYLWFFADFGFRKETAAPPKAIGSPQQAKSSVPEGNGQRTIVDTVPATPQQIPQQPADRPSDVSAASSGKPAPEKSTPPQALPPQKPALPAPEKSSGPAARPADKKPAPAPTAGYYIQVGYFSVEENAASLYADLKSKNYSAFVKKDKTKNGIRYRVLVGRYKNKDEAAKALKKISRTEKIRGAIYRL